MEQIFVSPNKDDKKNQILLQLRGSLMDNRALIDQIWFRFVFTGDPEEAERSKVLEKLREDLENKRYLLENVFGEGTAGEATNRESELELRRSARRHLGR